MRKLTILFFLLLSLSLSSLAVPQASYALDEAKAMIFIQKEHPESLSRSSRIFKQVLAEITEVLQQDYDMDIVDEVAATADTYEQRGGLRKKAELIAVATEADCDIAIILQVTPWMESKHGFKKVRSQIFLDAFYVDGSGRKIGLVDVSTEVPVTIRPPHKKPQIAQAAAEASKDVAAQAGNELGEQYLAKLARRDEKGGVYTIVFKKFNANELEDVLDAFSQIEGYVSHKQLRKTARGAKVEYKSSSDSSVLSSEFELILKDMEFRVTTSSRGSNITLSKMRIRKNRR